MSKADPEPLPSSKNIQVEVILEDPEWSSCDFDIQPLTQTIIAKTLENIGILKIANDVELSVKLTSNEETHKLNLEYRGFDKPASVLSFPSYELKDGDFTPLKGESHVYLGDIALGYTKVYNASIEREVTLKDHYTHLLVHSVLHLIGYEHDNEKDAKKMEDLEIKILKTFDIKNPYDLVEY